MHILLLTTYFKPDITANGIIMTQLAEELASLGHQVTVVTSMPHYDRNAIWPEYRGRLYVRERYNGLDVHRVYLYVPREKQRLLGRLAGYLSFNGLSLLAGALSGPYDVVLTPSPPLTNGLAAWLLGLLRGVPFVYNVQDIYPDVAVRLGVLTGAKGIAVFKILESFVYNRAAAVSVISEGFRQNLLAKRVPPDKLAVIPNFMDTGFVRPLPRANAFSRAQGLDGRYVVLFAGNVGLSQGLETVLDAAGLLAAHPEILFLIVGNGAAKPALEQRAAALGLRNLRFLPFQPHEHVPELYASADLCLVPLRRGITSDSVPSKVYTILAAGRPLVAAVEAGSDTGRFITQAGCGLCVPPEEPERLADAVLALYRDQERGRAMGQRGRVVVESRFTPAAAARAYDSLLRQVAAPAPPPTGAPAGSAFTAADEEPARSAEITEA